jgi:hypothetical protein
MTSTLARTDVDHALAAGGSTIRPRISGGIMLVAGVATLVGIGLPWGTAKSTTLNGLAPSMSIFALALVVVALISIATGVLALRGAGANWLLKGATLVGTVVGIAVWLILPAGVVVGAQEQAGVLTTSVQDVSFGAGAWTLAAGVTALVVGTMLLCTKRPTTTLIAMCLPLAVAALMVVELQ